ncbi:MAG TPA: hypothetical protein VJ903_03710 [Clostridia bacterium]|nr:hypothetical protein [Clostridia bacterium]
MYSIIGGILIFGVSIYIGFAINNIYKSRCDFLYEIPLFINFCDGEIAFYNLTIEEIVEKYSQVYPNSLIMKCINNQNDNINYKNELNLIQTITEGIKSLDRQSHKAFFTSLRETVALETEKAVKDASIRGNMAKRLSPLLGLGILILLI